MKNIKKTFVLFSTLGLLLLTMPETEVLADEAELAAYVPADALVYLEVKDLAAVLDGLVSSSFSENFLKSQVFEEFTLSKLANKLADRMRALEEATGYGVSVKNLQAIAGSRTAFALYDIGELRFLFLTKIPAEKVLASSLWNLRDSFEIRRVEDSDTEYFVKEDSYGQVSLAFTLVGDTLLVGTDVLRFENALMLLKNGGSSLAGSEKFETAFDGAAEYDDVLLYLDQQRIGASTYFRSYWIYGNQEELEDIESVGISVSLSDDEIREVRRIHRGRLPNKLSSDVSSLARLLPDSEYTEYGSVAGSADALKSLLGGFLPANDKTHLDNFVETISLAAPRDYGLAVSLGDSKGFHQDVHRVVAFRLENGSSFNRSSFESVLSNAYAESLLADGIGELKFVDRSGARILDIPLFETSAPAYRLTDDVLLISESQALLTQNTATSQFPDERDSLFSALRMDVAGTFGKTGNLLGAVSGGNAWNSTSNASFFGSNIPALFGILGDIEELTVYREVQDKTVVETVTYKIKE